MSELKWLTRCRYEEIVRDKYSFFSYAIQALGAKYDSARLQEVLDTPVHDARFNVGKVGRSIEGLSESNKLLLERKLIEHPQDLMELLHELPWWPNSGRRNTAVERTA
ncbi:MAG: hypothetical protein ABI759_17685 [Candidatus Solibacter sp.]